MRVIEIPDEFTSGEFTSLQYLVRAIANAQRLQQGRSPVADTANEAAPSAPKQREEISPDGERHVDDEPTTARPRRSRAAKPKQMTARTKIITATEAVDAIRKVEPEARQRLLKEQGMTGPSYVLWVNGLDAEGLQKLSDALGDV